MEISYIAYIALGSNLAQPVTQIKNAFLALEKIPQTTLIKKSSLYQTAPIGYAAATVDAIPDFINAVVALNTTLCATDLLEEILAIENKAGRLRPYHYAPRILDCDLLLHGDTVMQTEKLTLPHPRMHERGFVLLPLFEIAPQLILPKHGKIATLITPDIANGVQKLSI